MTLPVEALTPSSSIDDIKRAVARSIKQCVNEGNPKSGCQSRVYGLVERATGKGTDQLTQPGMEYGDMISGG